MYKCIRLNKFFVLTGISLLFLAVFAGLAVFGLRYAAYVHVGEQANNISCEDAQADTQYTEKNGIFVPVIMYHSIIKDTSMHGNYAISPDSFFSDMDYLRENGYTTVFVSDLIEYAQNDASLPEKPIVITFDDGYYNVMYYAYPYLKENNMKAVISVVGSYTEKSTAENDHNPQYSDLTWDEISELNKSGVFEIGNHTYDMHSLCGRNGCRKLSAESDEQYRKALFEDAGYLQDLLTEKSGVTPLTFAYPYGFISDESVDILHEIGFKAFLTCFEKPNYITKDCEYIMLNRYNRPSGVSTEAFMNKVMKE